MSQLAIPVGPEEITPEWFTSVFRENNIIASGAVVGVNLETIGQDWGFTGIISRVLLEYEGENEEASPSSVVVKFPTAKREAPSAYRTAQQHDVVAARRYFERCAREVSFYQQVAPRSAIAVPRLYYGAVDSETYRVILVLEDLRGTRIGDALRGCTPQDAILVVEQLAHFHSQWWKQPQIDTFTWLPLWGGDSQVAQSRYVQSINPFRQHFGQRVPQSVWEIIDALATSYGAVRSRLQQAPATIIHGDLHLDNTLFSPFEYEPGVKVIDWQSVAHGGGAIDLGLFLFGSLETPTQRVVENELLRRYHELLVADGVKEYSFSQLMEDCRLVLLWLLGAKVVWLGSMEIDRLSGREQALVEASLTEEAFTALLDYDVVSLLPF